MSDWGAMQWLQFVGWSAGVFLMGMTVGLTIARRRLQRIIEETGRGK